MSSVLDAIQSQYESNKTPESKGGNYEQDFSKYLSVNLEEGEENGEKTVRLLPPLVKGESPFEVGHWHSVKVGDRWRKLYCREKNDGGHCPLCETAKDLRAAGDDDSKKLARTYEPKKFYIVRVIDRDAEDDGVKFWRFPHNWKNEGVFDKLVPIFTKKGDITDPREGRDINLILTKDYSLSKRGFTKVSTVMSEDQGLLTDPKGEKAKIWMTDKTTWRDIYSAQPEEYLQLVADGETPVWDKNLEKFVAEGEQNYESESSIKDSGDVVSKPQTTTEDEDEEPF
jgi:hypothetical protein